MASLFFRNFHFFCIGGPLCSGSGTGSGKIEKWGWKLAGYPQPSRDWAKFVSPSRWLNASAPVGYISCAFFCCHSVVARAFGCPARAARAYFANSNHAPCPGVIPGSGRGCGRTARRVGGASRPAGGRPAAGGGGFGRRKPGAPLPGRRRSPPGAGRGRGRGGRR